MNFIQQPKAPGYLLQSNLHGSIVLGLACKVTSSNAPAINIISAADEFFFRFQLACGMLSH